MEDADYLRLFQRYLNESGGMLRRGGLERRDTTGERLYPVLNNMTALGYGRVLVVHCLAGG
jgi:hypothetical protein